MFVAVGLLSKLVRKEIEAVKKRENLFGCEEYPHFFILTLVIYYFILIYCITVTVTGQWENGKGRFVLFPF